MGLKEDYPFDEAIDDLERFINRIVVHEEVKKEFEDLFLRCRKEKIIPMRWVNVRLSEYRKEYKAYESFTDKEKKMLEAMMHFWG